MIAKVPAYALPTVHEEYHSDTASNVIPSRPRFLSAFYTDIEPIMKSHPHLEMKTLRPRNDFNHIAFRAGALLFIFETSDP